MNDLKHRHQQAEQLCRFSKKRLSLVAESLQATTTEYQGLQRTISAMQEELDKLIAQGSSYHQQSSICPIRITSLFAAIEHKQADVDTMQEQCDQARERLQEVTEQYVKTKQEFQHFENQCFELRMDYKNWVVTQEDRQITELNLMRKVHSI